MHTSHQRRYDNSRTPKYATNTLELHEHMTRAVEEDMDDYPHCFKDNSVYQLSKNRHKSDLIHYESLCESFNGTERNIQQVEIISDYAVFLASEKSGNPNIVEPMHEKTLNGMLREMCGLVGLFGRITIYSFRRGAIVDTNRKSGIETA